jgi:hypothetical protein
VILAYNTPRILPVEQDIVALQKTWPEFTAVRTSRTRSQGRASPKAHHTSVHHPAQRNPHDDVNIPLGQRQTTKTTRAKGNHQVRAQPPSAVFPYPSSSRTLPLRR